MDFIPEIELKPFSEVCVKALRITEIMLPGYPEECDKWHLMPCEKYVHIVKHLPYNITQGLLGSPVSMAKGYEILDHDMILAYVFVCELRIKVLEHVMDAYSEEINQDDKEGLQAYIDMNMLHQKRFENHLLEVRDGKPRPQPWSN